MTHPAYRAGAVLRAVRDAFPGRVTPAAQTKCSQRPDLMPTYLRYLWAEAAEHPDVKPLLDGWEPTPPANPSESEGLFWLGFWHHGAAKELPPTFPAKLKALRESAGLSGQQLAEAAGTTRQTIHNLEAGTHRPTWDLVQAIAAALGVPTDTFRDQ